MFDKIFLYRRTALARESRLPVMSTKLMYRILSFLWFPNNGVNKTTLVDHSLQIL